MIGPSLSKISLRIGAVYSILHYDTPLGRSSKLDCSTTKKVPIPNDTSSESSRRDAYNADLFGTVIIPAVEISTMEDRPRGGGLLLDISAPNGKHLCCTAHKKKCHFADFLHKCTTGSTSSCVFFLYNSMTFRRSATTSSTLVIPKCTTRRCTLRCSKIQCGKATALFVRSKHRDIVAQV